jgi:hypothetical protein
LSFMKNNCLKKKKTPDNLIDNFIIKGDNNYNYIYINTCNLKFYLYLCQSKLNTTDFYMGDFDNREREEVFSKKVRAGKRTYFFDVKATRSNDYYVTITESKKRLEDGVFIKHKIFLYKEDFEKFAEGLKDTIDYIKENQEVVEKRYEFSESPEIAKTSADEDFSFEI